MEDATLATIDEWFDGCTIDTTALAATLSKSPLLFSITKCENEELDHGDARSNKSDDWFKHIEGGGSKEVCVRCGYRLATTRVCVETGKLHANSTLEGMLCQQLLRNVVGESPSGAFVWTTSSLYAPC